MAKTKRPPQTRKKLGGPRVGEGGPRRDKADAVAQFSEQLSTSKTVLLTEYRGMTVSELAELRGVLREASADYKVYKNTLATIAVKNLGLDDLVQFLQGPTAFTFPVGDPVTAAKRLAEFAKKVPTLVIKGGLLEGKVLGADGVSALATLDSREVMLAKTAGMFLSPIQQAANLFAAAFNQVGSLLVQLRDKLPADGSAAPASDAAPAAEEPAAEPAADEPVAEVAATEEPVADVVATEEPAAEVAAPEDAPAETPEPASDDAPSATEGADGSTDGTTEG